MLSLDTILTQVEVKWLRVLNQHISKLFAITHIPSHGVEHHLRVWTICKELMHELSRAEFDFTAPDIENVIIAALFHDTGLMVDTRERHGHESRRLCEEFFKEHPELWNDGFADALHAIEHHDDKQLKSANSANHSSLASTLSIVSTADDLDAYGYIGIFRYIEIYLIRGISIDQLPKAVMQNLQNRFANFLTSFSMLQDYVSVQKNRFDITYRFFAEMDNQSALGNELSNGNIEIAKILNLCLIERKMEIMSTIDFAITNYKSKFVNDFFCELSKELNQPSLKKDI